MELGRRSSQAREAMAAAMCFGEDSGITSFSEILEGLEEVGPPHRYPATVEVYRQGSAATDVYVIESGLVKLVRSEQGGQGLITDLRFPGYLLGDAPVISQRPHPVTVATLVETRLWRIPAAAFCRLLRTNERFASGIRRMQSREAFDNVARITQLGCLPARHRLEHLICLLIRARWPQTPREGVRLEVPLKSWEVAQLIAVTPAYLSRLFNQLERDEILRRAAGWIHVPDPQKLWRWSE
jgi:CRP/FNR family transcriptional regulator